MNKNNNIKTRIINTPKKIAVRSLLTTIILGASLFPAMAVEVGETFDLATNDTFSNASNSWDIDVLTNVLSGDISQEAKSTSNSAWVSFEFPTANNLSFSLREDNSANQQVSRWRVQHKVEGTWKNLVPWQTTDNGGWTRFTADPNIEADELRFFLQSPNNHTVGVRDIAAVGKLVDASGATPPTITLPPSGSLPTDTDLEGYTGPNIGFFENKVFDENPTELMAVSNFTNLINDTARLKSALNRAKNETNGGVVILRANGTQKRFSLSHIAVPSNVRIEVEPGVVLEMRGIKENTHPTGNANSNPNKQFLFSFGRSNGPSNLLSERVENVEIRSTIPGRKFTIDATTNMPHNYGYMNGGNGNGVVNLTRAIPVGLFYVENFAISDIYIRDNHTESVAIQMFADADYKDGAYAWRFGSTPVFLEERYDNDGGTNIPMNIINTPLATNSDGDFIDNRGRIVPDMFAIQRNPTYGRTPLKGSINNISATNSHTGYGVVQVYGGDWIEINNIEAVNGIGVRLEAGNGTDNDNFNRSGPYLSSMNKINISNVKVTNGFTGVWLKPHSKIMKDITVENIEAIDSGTALLVGKGSFNCKASCRDLTRGRINNLVIKGDISLTQTVFNTPVAEVGNNITYLITDAHRQYLANLHGKRMDQLTRADLQEKTITGTQTAAQLAALTPNSFDNPSGTRWYKIFPTAPVLALSMLSATEVGDESATEGFYPVDFTQANITSNGLPENTLILYRGDMREPNGTKATDFINK
ncbi:hypothetical protein [Colwellia echini]|uniref:Right handed beta helix region n=1 Tax=Colwellia echini TaxID=1982103 RepID=A0ABY3MYG5_9GAMM|nr:hypothetical protein [Colwellia echini]TYK66275.1 hypothetical protein CWS31_006685 [Colwellia echini]